MRFAVALVIGIVWLAAPASVSGQVCAGSGSFGISHVQVGLDMTFADNAKGYHASLGLGGNVLFGGAAIAVLDLEDSEEHAKGLVFFGGAEFGGGRVYVCPIFDLEFMTLPDIANVEVTGKAFAGGGRVGIIAVDGPVRVIPTFGYFWSRETLTGKAGDVEDSVSRNFGLLQFGVGFAGRRVAFGPTLVVPVDLPDASTQLRVGVAFLF